MKIKKKKILGGRGGGEARGRVWADVNEELKFL